MKATRKTQPYRKGTGRKPGRALSAMLVGKPLLMAHPSDQKRLMEKRHHAKKRRLSQRIR